MIAPWTNLDVTEVVTTGIRQGAPLVARVPGELAGILKSEQRRIGIELGYTADRRSRAVTIEPSANRTSS